MDLKKLKLFGEIKNYKRGHVLYRISDRDENMYIILKGVVSVRYKINDAIKTEIFKAGQFFAETSVILDIPKIHTCVIEEDDTALLAIPKSNFDCVIEEDPSFSMRIMRLLSEQLLEALAENSRLIKELNQDTSQEIQESADMELPITKPKITSECEPDEEEERKDEQKEEEILQHKFVLDIPLLRPLKILRSLDVVPAGHKMYMSKQWPDAAQALSPKSLKCPICEKGFMGTYLSRSRMGIAKTRPDMRKVYKNIEPIYFEQYTCPWCGYSDFSADFNKISQDNKMVLHEKLLLIIDLPFDLNENIFDINYVFLKLFLSVFCAKSIGKSSLTMAKLWLRLKWLYEDQQEYELSELMLQKAYDAYFDAFYNTKTFAGEAENEALLLMGELALEIGDENKALNHFIGVLQSHSCNNVQRKKAEDRVYEIREKNKAKKAEEEKAKASKGEE